MSARRRLRREQSRQRPPGGAGGQDQGSRAAAGQGHHTPPLVIVDRGRYQESAWRMPVPAEWRPRLTQGSMARPLAIWATEFPEEPIVGDRRREAIRCLSFLLAIENVGTLEQIREVAASCNAILCRPMLPDADVEAAMRESVACAGRALAGLAGAPCKAADELAALREREGASQ